MHTKISHNLRYLRKNKGLSQAALAEQLGLNRGNIASYEKGVAEPNLSNLLKMVRFFEVDVIAFIDRDLSAESGSGRSASKANLSDSFSTPAALEALQQEAEQFEAILQGQKEYHRYKLDTYRKMGESGKSLCREYERLLEVSEEILAINRRLLDHLSTQN